MATRRQIEANRSNAKKSAGPKTPEGKAASSMNAIKHGVLSEDPRLLPWENSEEYYMMRQELILDLCPVGQQEWFLVNRIVNLQWRLVRAEIFDSAVSRYRVMSVAGVLPNPYHKPVAEFEVPGSSQDESSKEEPTEEEKPFQPSILQVAKAYMVDVEEGEVLSKLRRHETSLESSLRKATQELERLQARRSGAPLSHRRTIDVDNSAGWEASGSNLKDRVPSDTPVV